MEDKRVYRIEMDGEILQEEYPTPDAAMKAATKMFDNDPDLKEANIMHYVFESIGVTIRNKKM